MMAASWPYSLLPHGYQDFFGQFLGQDGDQFARR